MATRPVRRVLVDGSGSPLGRLVVAAAAGDPAVGSVVGPAVARAGADAGPLDVVLLAPGSGPERDGSGSGGVGLEAAASLLAALDGTEIRSIVVLSSAMVYGAWSDNPVPISEDAVLRPNP